MLLVCFYFVEWFHASLFNKMAQGMLEALQRRFRRNGVSKKLGALSMMWSDDGYHILCVLARRLVAVTYSSALFAKFIIRVRGCAHFM